MRRSFWFVAGASAGVYAAARARRAAEVLTVDGLRDRVGAVVVGARMFRDEVAQGKAEAETDLRERITLGLHERRELMAGPDRDRAEHDEPTAPTDQEEGTS
ncbi:MAG: DUF6167 family protein [Nocardioides sp.]|uniref:DUF6167 family protein n=1 Tax=Nocardioides sp. TaxID=35761 RepID=UPI0023A72EF2|nr:DUF6167 family protein [Nocardioides sp.]MDE0776966.1 DUF6167 family protein [Nocardioides sp.]